MKTQDQHKRLESFVEKWKQSQKARNNGQQPKVITCQGEGEDTRKLEHLGIGKPREYSSADNTHRYGSTSTCGFILEYQGKRYCSQENWINMCEDSGIQYKKIPVGYYLECHRK